MESVKPLPGTPEFTAATRANLLTALGPGFLGIQCAIIFSNDANDNEDRSRAVAVDPSGMLLRAIQSNIGPKKGQWSTDAGQNHNAHGYKVEISYRSRTTPSVQACKVRVVNGSDTVKLQYDYMLLLDVDKYSPFVNMPGHIVELVENVGSRTTDPKVIARMLAKAIRA